jgi:hypothetical protein
MGSNAKSKNLNIFTFCQQAGKKAYLRRLFGVLAYPFLGKVSTKTRPLITKFTPKLCETCSFRRKESEEKWISDADLLNTGWPEIVHTLFHTF